MLRSVQPAVKLLYSWYYKNTLILPKESVFIIIIVHLNNGMVSHTVHKDLNFTPTIMVDLISFACVAK